MLVLFVKQNTAYEMRISDWSSDVCSSDLHAWHVLIADRHEDRGLASGRQWRVGGGGRRDRIFVALEQQHEETEHGGPEAGGNPCEHHRITRQTGNFPRMASLVRKTRPPPARRATRLSEHQPDQPSAERLVG